VRAPWVSKLSAKELSPRNDAEPLAAEGEIPLVPV
jgi:hypothetical protein